MVEKPSVVLPLVWTFVPNALPQLIQNLTVKLSIEGLNSGSNSLWTVPWMLKKNDQHGIEIAVNLTHFIWPR
jgi:hypothetical protein